MSDEIMLMIGDDGKAALYDDTYDLTIHCESEEEQNEVKKALESIPKWIPCSERLPKDGQNVLVSYKTSETIHVCQYHNDGSTNPWYSYIDQCRAYMNVVIAWMPLPEPYKAESEEA